MPATLDRIDLPELYFGFVAPIGTDTKPALSFFEEYLSKDGYDVVRIKVTKIFRLLSRFLTPDSQLVDLPLYDRYDSHIKIRKPNSWVSFR
jgi:hypothetical protein